VNILRRHRPPCLTSGSQQGSISHHGNSLRVPEQPNEAGGKPLVRATIGISAPFSSAALFWTSTLRRSGCSHTDTEELQTLLATVDVNIEETEELPGTLGELEGRLASLEG
jgi:hypothetical protein